MNAMGEKISPCRTPLAMLNGLESAILPAACLMRATSMAAATMAGTIIRTFVLTPASARASSRKSWLSVSKMDCNQ